MGKKIGLSIAQSEGSPRKLDQTPVENDTSQHALQHSTLPVLDPCFRQNCLFKGVVHV